MYSLCINTLSLSKTKKVFRHDLNWSSLHSGQTNYIEDMTMVYPYYIEDMTMIYPYYIEDMTMLISLLSRRQTNRFTPVPSITSVVVLLGVQADTSVIAAIIPGSSLYVNGVIGVSAHIWTEIDNINTLFFLPSAPTNKLFVNKKKNIFLFLR